MSDHLAAGDRVILIDVKDRRYLVALEAGAEFHSHAGFVPHDDVIGKPDGSEVRSTKGARYRAFRATLAEWQSAIDERIRAVLPNFAAFRELSQEVSRLSARLDALEKRLGGTGPENPPNGRSGSGVPPAGTGTG